MTIRINMPDLFPEINTAGDSYEPHPREMSFAKAVDLAVTYQKMNPDWLVCGSVALMLANMLPYGHVSDVDFTTNRFPDRGSFQRSLKYYSGKGNGGYYHYEPIEYIDVFVHKNLVRAELFPYQGIRLQNISDVLFWKKQYDREKDKKDLININYLDDHLFEI